MVRFWPLALVACGRIGVDPARAVFDAPPDTEDPARWVQIQTIATSVDNGSDDPPTLPRLTLPMVPVQAHHLIIVAVQTEHDGNAAPVTVTDSSGCNEYQEVMAARSESDSAGGQLQLFYAKDSCAGADQIRIETRALYAAVAWEVAGIRRDDPVDAASALNDQPVSTAPVGPSIASTVAGDYVVSAVIVENSVRRAIHAGNAFFNDHDTFGNGWAHLTDATSGAGVYQAQWDQPMAGPYCGSAVAFFAAP